MTTIQKNNNVTYNVTYSYAILSKLRYVFAFPTKNVRKMKDNTVNNAHQI